MLKRKLIIVEFDDEL